MQVRPVEPAGGLLAVHAHPDDETLTSGALLATWSRAGLPVTLVTCTRGERGEVIGEGLAHLEGDGPALAAHRETELAAALDALGVRDQVFLDAVGAGAAGGPGASAAGRRFEDSGMAWLAPGIAAAGAALPERAFVGVPLDDAARRLAEVLLDRRPRVVATYEPGGGYGHPDHVRAHEVTVAAVDLAHAAAGESFVEELWCAVVPESLARAGRRALCAAGVPAGLTLPDPDGPLPPVAVPDDAPGELVAVPVGPVLGRVLAALRAHATQVRAVEKLGDGPAPAADARAEDVAAADRRTVLARYALSNDVLAPVPAYEHHAVVRPAVGGAASADVAVPGSR
ncbi:PIG-L family deacetylase [Cellulomonas sp. PhB143]|uniref:PIG-L family deacetylase n=1 Tax=Cellulomonas sp. PhB143 TaxID=2485186 RepID=UPI000F4A0BC4|nr:PIG-L family deacetylase [Cellulomonas sp. PhB143]ROS76923.1 N-acetyl-1-D-myo-inositol-2-amino-2-deoxy-alpha-D-glucopyranoside deacetylase [Cellulomonas sp. PhB143]